jgi:hypothetical protein
MIAGNISGLRPIYTSTSSNLLSMEGSVIDAMLNIAVFAVLILCLVGFGARLMRRLQRRTTSGFITSAQDRVR